MGEKGRLIMYTVTSTKNFENCVYDYEKFTAIKDAQDLGNDLNFNNNEITAISGNEFNNQIIKGIIPLDKIVTKDPLNPEIMYVFRKTLSGKYIPLHVTMRPSTADNLLKGSSRYGSISIDNE